MSKNIVFEGRTRDGREFNVRSYLPRDRDRVRWVCCETGFLGDPQEGVFIGRKIFADLWSSYWTDLEPESAFVAEVEGRVEGYILGCLDTHRQERVWNKKILPWAGANLANLIAGARGTPLRTHVLAAALGSLPGSLIYALLGAGVVSL